MTPLYNSVLLFLLGCFSIAAFGQQNKMFIFGHSLIDHRPPAIATPSDETTVPHWIYLLAKEAGQDYAAGGQYGFLPQHANTPPIAQWGYDSVPGVWESDTEPFSDANIRTVLITAGNFVQWQAPSEEYPSDPGVTPISATEDIVDWVSEQEDDVKYYIYENWPDMAGYLAAGFPPTSAELQNYYQYTVADFHDWWIEYQDGLLVSRPNAHIRMIPVGPIIGNVVNEFLSNVPVTELYEDDAPHGRASIYFLAGVVTYMAVYGQLAPSSFSIPPIVHDTIRSHYTAIVNYAWHNLQGFQTTAGESRVFFDQSTSSHMVLDTMSISLYPNPTQGLFQIAGQLSSYQIDILDSQGALYQNLDTSTERLTIDLGDLPSGLYFLRVLNPSNSLLWMEKIIKAD